jgi:hypothetical protein
MAMRIPISWVRRLTAWATTALRPIRQLVKLSAALVVRLAPFRVDQSVQFQAVERGIERPLFDAEHFFGSLLNRLRDAPPMHGRARQGFEDEHVEGSLD